MAASLPSLQFEAMLRQQPLAPVYLIVGEEDLLRDRAVGALKAAVLGDNQDFNCDVFYGDEASGADIVTCASEVPVFAERRLVIVKTAEKLSARDGEPLLNYLASPMDATTLAFVSAKLDGRLKLSQTMARAGVVVDCAPLREPQVLPWIAQEAEQLNVRLDPEARHLLKEMSGGSLYGIRRELEKLASYAASGRPVTAADVYLLRGMEPGASVFDLTLAVAESSRGRALSILARNLEAGEAPLRILGSLAWQYRRLWKVKELVREGGRDGEAARTLRMDPAKVRTFLGRFSDEHLQLALHLFLQADAQLKGAGSNRPKMVLERLLLRLCGTVSGQTTRESTRRPPASAGRGATRVVSNVRTIRRGDSTGR
ncbi:MAG: DNA polymerase III subunit delta [Nitrospiraceae bacterium]|nr:DNA polymerase III subunit delta [Nitrospiraceae bacterium]